jgi:hypothetical protein
MYTCTTDGHDMWKELELYLSVMYYTTLMDRL